MTLDEAIKHTEGVAKTEKKNTERNCQSCVNYKNKFCSELDMEPCFPEDGCGYFEARVSTQPSGDLISREETLTAFADYVGSGMSMNDYDALWNIVTKMPSVNPQPCKDTRMIDKSNFNMEQYKMDLQSAYDCGKASVAFCKGTVNEQVPEENETVISSTKMKHEHIWIVTYWNYGSEPVVTAFNDKEAANKCYEYFKKCHEDRCCLDMCPIYSHFSESADNLLGFCD